MVGNSSLQNLLQRKENIGGIGAIDFLIEMERKKTSQDSYPINYTPFSCKEIEVDSIEKYKKPPANFPKEFNLPPIKGLANDFSHLEEYLQKTVASEIKVSIVVLTYNRAEPLAKTLAGIVLQTYPKNLIEVIVTDDGGNEDTHGVVKEFSRYLDIKYVWHKDVGFTPAAARNNGVNIARNDFIILLDVDMMPSKDLVSNYVKFSPVIDKSVLIGPRKYIDINNLDYKKIISEKNIENNFTEIVTNNPVANRLDGKISIDWRLEIFNSTNNLKNEKVPFRVFASGNVAFSKREFSKIGGFEERFVTWGCEDTELGFRFFNDGKYMIPVMGAIAYHQEPKGGENETDRVAGKSASGEIFGNLCPYYRRLTTPKDFYEVPKVSIYIPAYNAQNTICDAIDSALKQSYKDLEVCVCDDGSTDSTLEILERYFSNNKRVRWVSQKNGGIGSASNTAVKMAKGIYIGQLDSDDYLAIDVVEKCVAEMDKSLRTGLVYTSYENEYPDGRIEPGYNYPVFTREKMLTAMIAHHFRMFRKIYWARTEGFNERIKNAVDYDMYLKLAEKCDAIHLNVRGYRRRLHGGNTSIVDFSQQMKNTAVVVNDSLKRIGMGFGANLVSENDSKLIFQKII